MFSVEYGGNEYRLIGFQYNTCRSICQVKSSVFFPFYSVANPAEPRTFGPLCLLYREAKCPLIPRNTEELAFPKEETFVATGCLMQSGPMATGCVGSKKRNARAAQSKGIQQLRVTLRRASVPKYFTIDRKRGDPTENTQKLHWSLGTRRSQ